MSEVKKNGMATASLVLGIISIPTAFMGWVGIICGILAIIFAIVAKNKIKADSDLAHTNGAATGGLITGIIGMVLAIIMIVIALMFVAAVVDGVTDLENLQEFGDAFSPVQKSTYIHSSSRGWNGYIFRYPSFESARRYCRDYDFLWQFVRCLFFSSHCNWNTLE